MPYWTFKKTYAGPAEPKGSEEPEGPAEPERPVGPWDRGVGGQELCQLLDPTETKPSSLNDLILLLAPPNF